MTDPHRRALTAAALSVAGCLLFTACGGSPAPAAQVSKPAGSGSGAGASSAQVTTPAATPVAEATAVAAGGASQACELVTRQEVGTAVGADPGAGKSFSSHGSSQCQYGSYQKGLVLVNLTPTRGRAGYDLMHSNPKLAHATNVSGIGDRAFEMTGPNTASIYFDKGDALVLVMVSSLAATSPPKAEVLALAKVAVGRV